MAIILEAAYSKKLGLPGFSSHSYVISVRSELTELSQVPEESSRLYAMLQAAVDKEMQQPGFVPDEAYGVDNIRRPAINGHPSNESRPINGNGHSNGHSRNGSTNGQNGNGHARRDDSGISERQLTLINDIVRENNARKGDVDQMAVDLFGGGIRTLNRMQASNLIDALFERYPKQTNNRNYRQPARS